jgi:hypothetical protein
VPPRLKFQKYSVKLPSQRAARSISDVGRNSRDLILQEGTGRHSTPDGRKPLACAHGRYFTDL